MPDRDPPIPSVPESRAVPKKHTRLSLVWVIPIVAAALGVWVAVTRIRSEGPKITIVVPVGRGAGGRQNQDQLPRRRRRHDHGDPAVARITST